MGKQGIQVSRSGFCGTVRPEFCRVLLYSGGRPFTVPMYERRTGPARPFRDGSPVVGFGTVGQDKAIAPMAFMATNGND